MKRVLSLMFVVGMMLALATGAQAASLTIAPTTSPGSIPSAIPQNEMFGLAGRLFGAGLTSVSGFFGSNITYSVAGTGSITFDYFGGEANFVDQFQYLGVTRFTHAGGVPGVDASTAAAPAPQATFSTTIAGSGLLLFNYIVNPGTGPVVGPVNGANPNNTSGAVPANFFASCATNNTVGAGGNPGSATAVCGSAANPLWLWLDDNGGLNGVGGPDDNDFDDMVIRVVITDGPPTVPEPTSFALLGSGLIGLGLAARKLRK